MTNNTLKVGVFVFVVVVFLLIAFSAKAVTKDKRIDAVASKIAERPVHVWCYAEGEEGTAKDIAPEDTGAWGYVFRTKQANVEHLANEVCEGILGILDHDQSVPLWKEGLGALVLTHESYHLRLNLSDRYNEGATECRAIRHVSYVIQFLGGTTDLVTLLMPYSLTDHWYMARNPHSTYHAKKCVVPNPSGWPDGS